MRRRKCKVHDWTMPEIGDDFLTCKVCGRELDLLRDITPNIRASIVNAQARHGDAWQQIFRDNLNDTEEDALERAGYPSRRPPTPAEQEAERKRAIEAFRQGQGRPKSTPAPRQSSERAMHDKLTAAAKANREANKPRFGKSYAERLKEQRRLLGKSDDV